MDLTAATAPVDPELFLWCSGIYQAAAGLSMPVENPGSRPLFTHNDKTYSLSDMPINRGMLAVMKELRERGVSQDEKMAITFRLMHFGEIFNSELLRPFIKQSEEPESVMISEALIKACATAKLVHEGDNMFFDLQDVARIAQELTDEEDSKR